MAGSSCCGKAVLLSLTQTSEESIAITGELGAPELAEMNFRTRLNRFQTKESLYNLHRMHFRPAQHTPQTRTFAIHCLLISLIFHLTAAFFSNGFYHYDEHYQILEFANYLRGKTPAAGLPWEFGAKMRPFLQPACVAVLFSSLETIGISDPFAQATWLRIFSGLLGWLSSALLMVLCVRNSVSEKLARAGIAGSLLVWYLPYLHARPSSEMWSASFFWIGAALLLLRVQDSDKHDRFARPSIIFWIGALWAIAFQARFQTAFMMVGLAAWFAWFVKPTQRFWLSMATGFAAITVVAAVCDRIGYGEWVFPPLHYARMNLVEGKASQWGTAPWYDYFRLTAIHALPPLSLVLIAGVASSWILLPRSVYTWTTLPFFVIHSLVPHKEFRFLFPLALVAPIQTVLVWEKLSKKIPARLTRAALSLLIPLNLLLMVLLSVRGDRTEIYVQQYLYRNVTGPVYHVGAPMNIIGYETHFYRSSRFVPTSSSPEDICRRAENGEAFHALSQSNSNALDCLEHSAHCEVVFHSVPKSVRARWGSLLRRGRVTDIQVYRCEPRAQNYANGRTYGTFHTFRINLSVSHIPIKEGVRVTSSRALRKCRRRPPRSRRAAS